MEQDTTPTGKKETWSVIVVVALVLLGGVFYGIDLYKQATKNVTISIPLSEVPTEGPVTPADY